MRPSVGQRGLRPSVGQRGRKGGRRPSGTGDFLADFTTNNKAKCEGDADCEAAVDAYVTDTLTGLYEASTAAKQAACLASKDMKASIGQFKCDQEGIEGDCPYLPREDLCEP